MKTGTVNISFQKTLLKKIDEVAAEESRTRSELVREAARMYIERKKKWRDLFDFGKRRAKSLRLKEQDVAEEIRAYRKRKGNRAT
jgi:metal-responsive CopG/Arc/MetJ family transcriptional regulator